MQRRRFHSRAAALWAAAAVAGVPLAAQAADSWSISIGVRETGSAGAIGSNGGTSGPIEWIDLDGFTIDADNTWQTVTWNFTPGAHTATSFSGGDGVLAAANNKGVLEHIRIRNTGGNSGGEIRLRIDDIVNTVSGTPMPITGFEEFSPANANDTIMFREPIFSGSTIANMSTGANGTLISTASANTGAQSMAARWTFVPNGDTDQWLRLTTNNASTLGNPIIDIGPTSSLSIAFRMSVYNPSGTRVRGIDASQFQGSGHDWARAARPMSEGGGGMSFAFLRATRGGTSGTSTTGSMRVDDPQYVANITGAKAAGLLTGPYHFGRPDVWTPDDAVGLGNAPGSVGTPEDEARHYLQVAGNVMKPGYMRPVYDLEDGNEELNNEQLTNFVLRFNDTLKKYKGPAAQIIVYAGTSYANSVNEPLSQFPLWMPRFQVESDWAAGDIFPNESSYGVWGDGNAANELPWNFWQYYSPDVYIPGINAGTHNDIDVAHGDINYVRQFLVQGAIWDGSSNNQWANGANWSTNAAPSTSTEVLLDLGTPTTIDVGIGRQASGVYFADNYTLSGGSLTLSDGRIDVDATKTATLATDLSTPNGFRKVGTGALIHASGSSTVTGTAQVLQGTMNVSGGSIDVGGDVMVNPELTQFDKSLVEPFPADASQITSAAITINGGALTAFAAYVGGTDTASGAIGTLNVSSGFVAVTGPLKIWNSTVLMVDSKVNLTGGTLSVGSLDTDGDTASFNWTGGIFAVTGASGLSVASGGPIGSSLTVGTGKQLIVFNALSVGASSTITLQNNGVVTVGSLDVGGVQSRFGWTGGTFTINGPGTTNLGSRTIGTGAAPMFFNINGGSVTNGTLTVGALSSGTVSQTGGTHTISGLNIGVGVITTGTHSVSGSANLNVTGNAYVGGGSSAASGGTGILNISGGGADVNGTLKIWDSGPAAPGGTRLNLTGGTLSVGRIDFDSNPARFNFAGGTLNHQGPGTSDLSGLTFGASLPSSLNINGGTITATFGSSITTGPVGVLAVNNGATLDAELLNNGTMIMNGGTVTWPVDNQATMNVTGANPSTFSNAGTVDNAGTINVESGAVVSFNAGVAGPGAINVASGATMTTLALASGTLDVAGTLTVTPNAPTGFVLVGDLSVNGTLDVTNNDLIVDYTGGSPEFELRDLAVRARDVGDYGIFFTRTLDDDTVLAFGEASELGITDFNGFPLDDTTIVGKYTYYGDANFDGQVTTDDYVAVDLGLGTGDSWVQGDFDLNGAATTDDYVVVDLNLGKGTDDPLAYAEEQAAMIALHTEMFGQSYVEKLAYASEFGWVAASVPEPGTLGIAAFASALTGITRRRRLVKTTE